MESWYEQGIIMGLEKSGFKIIKINGDNIYLESLNTLEQKNKSKRIKEFFQYKNKSARILIRWIK